MRRSWFIALGGLALALAAFIGFYYAGTAETRRLTACPEPELAWLKAEFQLSDAEFARVSKMHEAYLAGCSERCRLIDQKNAELKRLLAATNTVTPEISAVLSQASQLRAQCQQEMLQHFYAISQTMPPEQGKRYLQWVQERTVLANAHRGMQTDMGNGMEMEGHHH